MKVPFLDLHAVPSVVRDEWKSSILDTLDSGIYIGGPAVQGFEEMFSEYCGVKHCVGTGNGLDAISIALQACGIGPESRVAVPAHTFIATWLAVLSVGAKPIGIDCDSRGQLDVASLIDLEERVDAVIPVHMHGATVDMPLLVNWAHAEGVVIVEDCSQAAGARILGKHVGTWGEAGAFSFYPTKNLGAVGDAGAIITPSDEIAAKARSLGNYGSNPGSKYLHPLRGQNSRLDPVQASVLSVNLKYLDMWNEMRTSVASRYLSALGGVPRGVEPLIKSCEESVWHHFVLLVEDRNAIREAAWKVGIDSDIHYPVLAADEISLLVEESFFDTPRARNLSSHVVSLPISPWMTPDQILLVENFLHALPY